MRRLAVATFLCAEIGRIGGVCTVWVPQNTTPQAESRSVPTLGRVGTLRWRLTERRCEDGGYRDDGRQRDNKRCRDDGPRYNSYRANRCAAF